MILFKHADLLRNTHATASQVDYWMRLGLLVPYKDATASGHHRQFSILNVIDVALLVWLATIGMSTDRMKQIFALRRQTLAKVRPEHQNVQAWLQYVHMVLAGAKLIGMTDDPAFKAWEREVQAVIRGFTKKPVAPDERLLELVIAQQAACRGGQRPHVVD